ALAIDGVSQGAVTIGRAAALHAQPASTTQRWRYHHWRARIDNQLGAGNLAAADQRQPVGIWREVVSNAMSQTLRYVAVWYRDVDQDSYEAEAAPFSCDPGICLGGITGWPGCSSGS